MKSFALATAVDTCLGAILFSLLAVKVRMVALVMVGDATQDMIRDLANIEVLSTFPKRHSQQVAGAWVRVYCTVFNILSINS